MRTTTDPTTTRGPGPGSTDHRAVPATVPQDDGPLGRLERGARELVPDLVGLSLCRTGPDGPVTLATTSRRVALLDALQHLDGGPAPVRDRDVVLEDRIRWPHLSRGAAAAGVRSTRACTVEDCEVALGEVHLYAAGVDPTAGHADELAALLDGAGLADLLAAAPTTEDAAAQPAPRSLRADGAVHRVIGQLVVRQGADPITAHERLEAAARHGGVECAELAAVLVDLRP